jgi:hypothetical protein
LAHVCRDCLGDLTLRRGDITVAHENARGPRRARHDSSRQTDLFVTYVSKMSLTGSRIGDRATPRPRGRPATSDRATSRAAAPLPARTPQASPTRQEPIRRPRAPSASQSALGPRSPRRSLYAPPASNCPRAPVAVHPKCAPSPPALCTLCSIFLKRVKRNDPYRMIGTFPFCYFACVFACFLFCLSCLFVFIFGKGHLWAQSASF